ncbi:hypothetical protein AYJ59_12625 [Thiomicrospira sp. S5]|nr:hypothetical protein AYJ59_12625 [Thiomicrospira sp. S5]
MVETRPFQNDWIAKTLAGVLLGFTLGVGISGLFMAFSGDILASVKVQLAMWIVTPVWLVVISASYAFRNGWQAWLWLGLVNFLVFGLFFGLHLL